MQFKISSDINLKEKLQFFFLNLTFFGCHHIHSILFSLSGYTLAMELDFFFFFFLPWESNFKIYSFQYAFICKSASLISIILFHYPLKICTEVPLAYLELPSILRPCLWDDIFLKDIYNLIFRLYLNLQSKGLNWGTFRELSRRSCFKF